MQKIRKQTHSEMAPRVTRQMKMITSAITNEAEKMEMKERREENAN